MKEITERECLNYAIGFVVLLGEKRISIGQAKWVLSQAERLLESTQSVNPGSPELIALIQECESAHDE